MIHETAIIEHTAIIGGLTNIWHFCHIDDLATIGDKCSLGQNTYVGKGVSIGNGVKIQNNVSIYSGVTILDDVFIGPNVTFTNIKYPRSFINQKKEFEETIIGYRASLGANCTIIAPCKIGYLSVVAAGAVVTKNVPQYSVVAGNPAKIIRGIYRYGVLKEDVETIAITIPKGTLVESQYIKNSGHWSIKQWPDRGYKGYSYTEEKNIEFIPTEIIFDTHLEHRQLIKIF